MPSFLGRELLTAALCWRLERRDGVALGFTSHDRDLVIEGLTYRAAPGMLPSAVSVSDGFDADSVDVKGALSSDAIRAEDLRPGRWDGARVAIFLTDWGAPGAELLPVARGVLGEMSLAGAAFEAELKGPSVALDAPAVEQTSPECRAQLGDKRCRVDMAARVRTARVVRMAGDQVVILDADEPSAGAYAYGRLRWLTGANSGLEAAMRALAGGELVLQEAPVFAPAAGDLVEVSEGCDRSLATCAGRFGNVVNFRGEPHLPGTDLLTRYPGG
jgi:uncharacterized phage protein (TIGR02218 family)